MAVYTHVDDRTLRNFLDHYDVGAVTTFKGIAEGVENSNYLLETDKDRFILTLYEKRADPEDLPYFLDLMDHLASAGLPAPRPIRDTSGEPLQSLMNRPACLISFLTGVSVDIADEDHCAALGTMLAKMHLSSDSFGQSRPNDLSVSGWQKLADATLEKADTVRNGLQQTIVEEMAFLQKHWPTGLPKGTIHADLFPDNILFSEHTISGIIDFYFACTDFWAYDLAICVNAWCFDEEHRFVPAKAKRLIEMYDAERSMTAAEISALPILCRGAAMRFLLTRLFDWLNPVEGAVVSPKDPIDYLARLKFHQQVKDAASYVV